MALYTTQTPYQDNFSKNDIIYKLVTTSAVTDAKLLAFALQIQDYTTGVWSNVYNGLQRFDANGQSEVDLKRYCDSQLEFYVAKPWDQAVYTHKYIVWKKQARNFRVIFWESDDQIGTQIIPDSFFVLKGGVNAEQWNADAVNGFYFNRYMMRFLTYNRLAYRDQGMLFVSFYVPYAGGFGGSLRRVTYGSTTGTTTYSLAETAEQGDVISFFIDITNLPPDVYKIDFELYDSGSPVSEKIVFEISGRRFSQSKIYTYINSLGGTDVAYLPYNQTRQSDQSRDVFARLSDNVIQPYAMQVNEQSFQANQLEELTTGIEAGALSPAATEQMRELAISPARFEVDWLSDVNPGVKYIPVNVTTKRNILANNRTQLPVPVYFEITRAVRNMLFSPARTDCAGALPIEAWANIPPPVDETFYLLLTPAANPGVFAFNPSSAKIGVDYGDGHGAIETGSTTYTYANDSIRQITMVTLLKMPLSQLSITTAGKVSKIWGAIPYSLGILKLNNQALTAMPSLPMGLTELELENNLLTRVPTLPPNLIKLKAKDNSITDFVTTNIPASCLYVDLSNNELPVAVVNYILNKLYLNGGSNGTVKLNGQTPAATPTGIGATAVPLLLLAGWSVTTD